jgi:hypothetical protein
MAHNSSQVYTNNINNQESKANMLQKKNVFNFGSNIRKAANKSGS